MWRNLLCLKLPAANERAAPDTKLRLTCEYRNGTALGNQNNSSSTNVFRGIIRWHCTEERFCGPPQTKGRLNPGNACYHSVQNLLCSYLLSKTIKIKIYRTIILPVVLYGCKNLCLILGEKLRLRVLENRMLRNILSGWSSEKKNRSSGAYGTYGGEERCKQGFGEGNLRERFHFVDLSEDGGTILKLIFNK